MGSARGSGGVTMFQTSGSSEVCLRCGIDANGEVTIGTTAETWFQEIDPRRGGIFRAAPEYESPYGNGALCVNACDSS